MSENPIYKELITSTRWAKLRARKLTSQPRCEECLKKGKLKIADQVHHVIPVERGVGSRMVMEELCFDFNNLESVCEKCHKEIHRQIGSFKNKQQRLEKQRSEVDNFLNKYFDGNRQADKQAHG